MHINTYLINKFFKKNAKIINFFFCKVKNHEKSVLNKNFKKIIGYVVIFVLNWINIWGINLAN
jgi:hypothetical protein